MVKQLKYLIIKINKKLKINCLIILIFLYIKNNLKIKYNRTLLQKIKKYENQINITEKIIKEFRNINSNNLLINNKSQFRKNPFPEITVLLLIFNQAHCLHKALRSIQNQSIKNLEIIIIDDCSTDNSNDLIKNYQKEDDRIILIRHEINQGKIKSRSDGIKLATGKYITLLDGDDALIHKDILLHSLYIANIGDLDVVEFKIIIYQNGFFKKWHNNYLINTNDIIYQPELRTKFFLLVEDYGIRTIQNANICGKIIKTKVFKKVIINIGPKYTEDFILSWEDIIMTVSLFQTAKSYYYMKENGYYYSQDDKKKLLNKFNKKAIRGMGQFKLLQFLIEKTRNNKIERQMIFREMIHINYLDSFYKYINTDYKRICDILDIMIKSRFLSKNQKQKILLIKNVLNEKKERQRKY
jgi:glycosyltransferase involved in cell wall biosynthesis